MPGRKLYYVYEPKGVVAVISPWNYPFCLSVGPVVSAIAAGNTVVLKPSSQTTDCGIIVKEVLEKAGLPEGVVNVATGSGSVTGQALIENTDIDMFFFTGSTEIGKKVNMQAAERLIPTIMELGGKDAAIVTKNADLDRAAHTIAWGAFSNCGQTCIGMEICLVERPVYNQFMEKLMAIVKNLKSGNETGCVGSMTMKSQYDIVEGPGQRRHWERGEGAARGCHELQAGRHVLPSSRAYGCNNGHETDERRNVRPAPAGNTLRRY